jgi:pilus assembly protein Flp/PilA
MTKEKVMKNLLGRVKNKVTGATAIEYGLIAALIAVAIITAVSALGTSVASVFQAAADALSASVGGGGS